LGVNRRLLALLGTPVAVVVCAGSALAHSTDDDQRAFVVTERKGHVSVELLGASASAAGIEAALRDHGIRVKVVARPVSPSLEGTWLGANIRGSGLQGIVDLSDQTRAEVPHRAKRLTLELGRRARPREIYDAASNALCPGEALAGSGIADLPPADAAAALDEMGIAVSWRFETTTSVDPGGGHSVGNTEVVSEAPDGVITSIAPASAKLVYVFVSPPDDYLAQNRVIPTAC
jgi:hypothetical protein